MEKITKGKVPQSKSEISTKTQNKSVTPKQVSGVSNNTKASSGSNAKSQNKSVTSKRSGGMPKNTGAKSSSNKEAKMKVNNVNLKKDIKTNAKVNRNKKSEATTHNTRVAQIKNNNGSQKNASEKVALSNRVEGESERGAKAYLKNKSRVFADSGLQGKRSKVIKRDNANRLLIGLSAISFVLIMVVTGQFFLLESSDPSNTLQNGTMINGVNVGGMGAYEAEQLLSGVFNEKADSFELAILYKDDRWGFNKSDFTVNSGIHTIIEEAQMRNEIVDDYNLQSYKLSELKKEGVSINVAFNYIFVGLDEKIDEIINTIEIEPVNSEIEFDANSKNCFSITEHKNGLRVNKEQLYYDINNQFNKTNKIEVEVVTVEEEPQTTKEYNNKLTSQVSTFCTYVSDSTGARKSNVKKALEYFNGFVLQPGEEVSFNKITGPHSLENGYKIATVIYNGRFVDGIGGGICQASTTLYNALLLADVEILEVCRHTIPVKYVPLATDAMVAEYVADLRFKNTNEYPLFIQTKCDSECVSVNIFSHELDKRIKVRSETVATLPHGGDEVKLDENGEYADKVLFKGERFRLTYPRDGFEAKAYLEYYQNGEKVSEKLIRHAIYKSQNGIIIEGIEEVPAGMQIIEDDIQIKESFQNDLSKRFTPTYVSP